MTLVGKRFSADMEKHTYVVLEESGVPALEPRLTNKTINGLAWILILCALLGGISAFSQT